MAGRVYTGAKRKPKPPQRCRQIVHTICSTHQMAGTIATLRSADGHSVGRSGFKPLTIAVTGCSGRLANLAVSHSALRSGRLPLTIALTDGQPQPAGITLGGTRRGTRSLASTRRVGLTVGGSHRVKIGPIVGITMIVRFCSCGNCTCAHPLTLAIDDVVVLG
jgi:hypothetical protein